MIIIVVRALYGNIDGESFRDFCADTLHEM